MTIDKQHHFSLILIILLALTFSACSTIRLQINEFTKKESKLPRDMQSAEEDYDILKETSCIITINDDSGVFLIGKEQIAKEQLSEKVGKLMADKTPDKRIVYLESAFDVKYQTILEVLNLIRKADIDKIGLIALREKEEKPGGRPSRFEIKLPAEPKDMSIPSKPNPLTLIANIDKTGNLSLNPEQMGNISDPTTLINKLMQVFKERADNAVFREGTNEIEKTTFVKASRSVAYGDVLKLINAVKSAGASPIWLQIDNLTD